MKNKIIVLAFIIVLASSLVQGLEGHAVATARYDSGELSLQNIRIGKVQVYSNDKMIKDVYETDKDSEGLLFIVKNTGGSSIHNLHILIDAPEGVSITNVLPDRIGVLKPGDSALFKSSITLKDIALVKITARIVSEERTRTIHLNIKKTIKEMPVSLLTRQNILAVMAAILLLVLVLSAYELWPRMRPEPRIAAYIRKCRFLGISDEEITNALVEAGWSLKIVRKHMKIVK